MELIPIALKLAEFAPAIIRWLSGSDKAEAVAQEVVDVATRITGASTPDEALNKLSVDPALQLQFRQAMLEHEARMDQMYLADRQDARRREVELAQTGHRNVRADVMVGVDAVGLVVCLIVLAVYRNDLPGEVVALISTIASIFGVCLRDAHQYEFGSSRGSREKDALLSRGGAA